MVVNVSPFLCYSVGFSVALLTYSLGWSDLYPELSLSLVGFLVLTIVIHLLFANRQIFSFRRLSNQGRWPFRITALLYLLWILEFLYAGGIPLYKILLRQPFDYKLFGIPTLHVFVVTFSSFYTVYLYHVYLSEKSKRILALVLINMLAAILIYNRGMFLINLASCTCLYLVYARQVTAKQIGLVAIAGVGVMFFFGVMGNIRSANESKKSYNNRDFLRTGGATQQFRTSVVPKEFFWTYIYLTSPIANLQQTIDHAQPHPGIQELAEMINNEVMMDFISKRINRRLQIEAPNATTIPGPFNVSTIYSRSFSYMGWAGLILMAVIILLVPFIYRKLLPADSSFFLSGWVIMCTMFLFMCFDNTLRFTGLSFQLVYPIALHYSLIVTKKIRGQFVNNKVTSL